MKIIDLHQDLMTHIRFRDVLGQDKQTDFEMLKASPVEVVVATAFPFPKNDDQYDDSVHALIEEEIDMYNEYVRTHDNWSLLRNGGDFNLQGNKLLLHIEGLNVFDGSSEHWECVRRWKHKGVRSIGTHWNLNNQLGGGTNSPEIGLTDLGREFIAFLEAEKLVFDLAHMSRKGFFEAAQLAQRPLYVSHGNADALCTSVRNYTDEQLRLIAQSGGVIGVFFPNTFVVGRETVGGVHDVVRHVRYIADLIGVEHVAIGSDFGGIVSGTVTGLSSVSDYPVLVEHLYKIGFTETEIEKILYTNACRVLKSHLQ